MGLNIQQEMGGDWELGAGAISTSPHCIVTAVNIITAPAGQGNDQDQVPISSVMYRVVMTSLEPGSRAQHPHLHPTASPGHEYLYSVQRGHGHVTRDTSSCHHSVNLPGDTGTRGTRAPAPLHTAMWPSVLQWS